MLFIHIALRNLLQAKRRTFLLVLALSLVTTLLVILLSLSAGINDTLVRTATTLVSGHVNVAGFYKARASDAMPVVTDTKRVREVVQKNTPGLVDVVDRARGWARIVSVNSSLQASLTGIDIKDETRFPRTIVLAKESEYLEGGRDQILGDIQGLAKKDGALIFAAQAKRLGVKVGDALTVTVETFKGMRNSAEFTIVAIAQDIGFLSNFGIFTNKEGLKSLYRLGPDVTGAVQIYLESYHEAPKVLEHLREVLQKEGFSVMEHEPDPFFMKFEKVSGKGWTGQKLDVTTWRDEISYLESILQMIDGVSISLLGVLLFIIALGIMNSMWMAVRERTSEIGTLRAMGMSRQRVLLMFLTEAMLLGLIGTILGVSLGALIALGLDAAELKIPVEAVKAILMSDTLHLVLVPSQLVLAVVSFTLLAAVSALWPAYKATQLQPVTAIQHIR